MSVGCREVALTDPIQGARIPLWLLYPTHAKEQSECFGMYSFDVAMNAPVVGEQLPLVLISHGKGGTPWGYRATASYLARSGFVVALPEHPGNSRNDNSLDGTVANLENRPRHLCLVIDAAFADVELGKRLAPGGVAVIGHSMGGYTALAAAGGHPAALPNQVPEGRARPLTVASDPRIRALVLLAPAVPWYMLIGSLAEVAVPILLRVAEKDEYLPPEHAEIVLRGVPDRSRIDHQIVPGAGHFAFVTPFPPALTRPEFPPSQDPPGFDRPAYLQHLHAELLTFLRAHATCP